MEDGIKGKVAKGFFWVLIERFSTQFVGFCISLVLARLLCPAVYGIIALTSIFITISTFLIDSGFTASLIQKKTVRHVDLDSVFYFNLGVALFLYSLLFVFAPTIARFYNEPQLVAVLRVLSFNLVILAVNAVQKVELMRRMLFHLSFRASLVKCFAQGCIGIVMAYMGYGVWALVISEIVSSVLMVVATWFWVGWRPRLAFSFSALSGLMRFGWKIFASGVWGVLYNNIYGVVVGRLYTPTDLGLYNKGNVFPHTAMSAVQNSVIGVVFPAFSKVQDDKTRLLSMVRKLVRCFTVLTMPLLGLLVGCADPLVRVLLGEKWLATIPYLQIGCLVYFCFPTASVPIQAIKAIGRSDLFMVQNIISGALILLSIAITFAAGPIVMAAAVAFAAGPLDRVVTSFYSKRFLGYGYLAQVNDVLPGCLIAMLICMVSFFLRRIMDGAPQLIILASILVAGVGFSILYAIIFRPQPIMELIREPKVRDVINRISRR